MHTYERVHCVHRLLFACVMLVAFLIVSTMVSGCAKDAAAPARGKASRGALAFPVEVAKVEQRPVVYTITAVGSVEAFEIVQVTARVAGVVERVRFAEGTSMGRNAPLIDIEPDRYRLAEESAKATLAKAEAALSDARAGLARREGAVARNPGLIPGEEIETWRTKTRAAEADVAQAKAALNQAELNLRDALVRAPVAGVIQTRSVQTGQYVQPGTVLATLVRRDPLLVRFKVTEQDAPRLSAGGAITFTVRGDERTFKGRITLVAAAADEASRMVPVTAEVTDPARASLRPGSFAEVSIPIGEARLMPVVPQTAIRASERGFLSYTVDNGKATEHILTLGLRTEDGHVEVLTGLDAGETLVIRGGEALRDGAAVRIVTNDEAKRQEKNEASAEGVTP